MATRKSASKSTTNASLSFNLNTSSKKPSKRQTDKTTKQIKKLGTGAILLILLFLAVGVVGGFFGIKLITKNDCFEIIGEEEITLTLDQTYKDDGVKVISFGKDFSNDVNIKTNLTLNPDGSYSADEEGTYYIQYTVDNILYGKLFKIKKIRLVSFVGASEADEFEEVE